MTTVHSFHTGAPLNLWERCCLRSFADHGHEVVLFSYDQLDVPPGVELVRAEDIISESRRGSFFAIAPGQYGQFSDLFRYELLHARGGWWIDTDMLCLSDNLPSEEVVIGKKRPLRRDDSFRVNGAAMRFPAGHPLLKEASTVLNADINVISSSWRSIAGPDLLTRLVPEYGIAAREISLFYPIGGRASWDFCNPAQREEVALAVAGSPMIYLWQELFRAAGLPRDRLPPKGSFLAEAFTRHGGASAPSLGEEELKRFIPERRTRSGRSKRPRALGALMSRLLSAVRK